MADGRVSFKPDLPYVILCEGRDAEMFLRWYLKYLIEQRPLLDKIYVHDFGGISELNKILELLPRLAHYQDIKGFLLIRDAETRPEVETRLDVPGVCQSIANSLKRYLSADVNTDGHYVNNDNQVKVGFTLFPGLDKNNKFINGTLEDLCVNILKTSSGEMAEKELMSLASEFIEGVNVTKDGGFKRIHKNRLHAYFSGTDTFVGMKIGEAAKCGCFDFASPRLDFLKEMLFELVGN